MNTRSSTLLLATLLFCAPALAQTSEPEALQKKPVNQEATTSTTAPSGLLETQKNRGSLKVAEPSWDFGYVVQGAKVTHIFVLENTGIDSLFIEKVKPTCGCTSAPLTRDKLAPGENVPVTVTFSTGKFSGPVHKTVTVSSSDPEKPTTPLQFSAIVGSMPPTLGLSPETGIALDRFEAGEPKEARVELTNYSPTAMALSIVGAPPEFLEARLSGDHLEPRQSAQLIVRSREGGAPLGSFTGAVTLQVLGEQNARLTIPVTGISMMK